MTEQPRAVLCTMLPGEFVRWDHISIHLETDDCVEPVLAMELPLKHIHIYYRATGDEPTDLLHCSCGESISYQWEVKSAAEQPTDSEPLQNRDS